MRYAGNGRRRVRRLCLSNNVDTARPRNFGEILAIYNEARVRALGHRDRFYGLGLTQTMAVPGVGTKRNAPIKGLI